MHELTESYIGNCCRTRANVFADEKDREGERLSANDDTRHDDQSWGGY